MARKKIVFIIVEGPSDSQALAILFSKIFSSDSVYVHVTHGDITTRRDITSQNIFTKITDEVKSFAGNALKASDFKEIIHIIDTDGAYIPDENIIKNDSAHKAIYSLTEINAANRDNLINRNEQKRNVLNKLIGEDKKVWGSIPYRVFYMSCNLDHVLYNKMNSTDDEKELDAFRFAKRYKDNIPAFIKYISESEFSVMDDYIMSWTYIKEELHSLERHSNLGLCFKAMK